MWLLDRLLRRFIRKGRLTVIDPAGARRDYGEPDPALPEITVRIDDTRTARAILREFDVGAGEAYMDGRLIIQRGDIRGLLTLIRANAPWESGVSRPGARGVTRAIKPIRARLDRINWAARARRNVAHHYDLSDRLYEIFLDRDRQYSAAYFTDPANDLDTAQADKKAHILAKLNLTPGVSTLDIGCGWGGMALSIHKLTGGEVLGVTLSEQQLGVARERAEAAGVADKVRFELSDYRAVAGRFDRIVSVGMFEHVGPPHYRAFFAKCRALLADDGVMLLHTIGRMGEPGVTDAFTAKYIFPGGYIPALSEIVRASEPTRLIAADIETLRLHYAYTIDHWYERTLAAREELARLHDERFVRMWLFYLAGAATAFSLGTMCNYQIQYIKRRDALPITRDYIAEAEGRLRPLMR